ncbi:1,4-dihydroxy-2-naphthoate prenyltransferase [Aliidiomarina taiwanensis]|uniref:1,4-dihydroxy-2-naphthoate prenyltransferase n=1 Tax=Aliidiomarina taiwanensis TaxID=946228 RepID=A0A432X9J1_9GAMM|nr:prenyltransferase [Aliidiomarina taiwanensis]RUO43980.1 1,4-dihydroxy-2-naphthoate prenyltransferase [Aliidiomarina taiwanensis]
MLKTMKGVARLNFLTLTLLCVLLAMAYAIQQGASVALLPLLFVCLVAFGAHMSVNAFNEYFDFRSGLDKITPKTPFSGGSGTLVKAPEKARIAYVFAWLSLLVVVCSGLALTAIMGWPLLLIGVPGVLIIYTYTQHINRLPIVCLMAPGIGFGFFMTLGAIWVFYQQLTPGAWLLGAVVALLVNNLLLLNQFPDADADFKVGRRTLPIVWGKARCTVLLAFHYVLCFILVGVAVLLSWLPLQSTLVFLCAPLLYLLLPGIYKNKGSVLKLTPYLGLNVVFIHAFLLLLIAGLFWAWW